MENRILKETLKSYINLEYYANGIDKEYQVLLKELEERCAKYIDYQPSLSTKSAYSLVFKAIKEEVEKFKKELEPRLEEEAEIIMNYELTFLDTLYNSEEKILNINLDKNKKPKKTKTIIPIALAVGGVSLSKILFTPSIGNDTISQFAERTEKNILRAYDNSLRSGYIFGKSSEDIKNQASNNIKQVSKGMSSGIKTAIPSFAKTTDRIVFLNNNLEVIWVSTLDGNTCLKCSSLSGTHYKSMADAPLSPHCLCRCVVLPLSKVKEPVPDFNEFINSLSEDEQKQVLGKNRFTMWKQYGIKLDKFLNQGEVIPLKDLKIPEN